MSESLGGSANFRIHLHRDQQLRMSTWALSQFLQRLASHHYKLELLRRLREEMVLGRARPAQIVVFSRSATPLVARLAERNNAGLRASFGDLLDYAPDQLGMPYGLGSDPYWPRLRHALSTIGPVLEATREIHVDLRPTRGALMHAILEAVDSDAALSPELVRRLIRAPFSESLSSKLERIFAPRAYQVKLQNFATEPESNEDGELRAFLRALRTARRPVVVRLHKPPSANAEYSILCADLLTDSPDTPTPFDLRSFAQESPADLVITAGGVLAEKWIEWWYGDLDRELRREQIGTERYKQIQARIEILTKAAQLQKLAEDMRQRGLIGPATYITAELEKVMADFEQEQVRQSKQAVLHSGFRIANLDRVDFLA